MLIKTNANARLSIYELFIDDDMLHEEQQIQCDMFLSMGTLICVLSSAIRCNRSLFVWIQRPISDYK